MRSAYDYTHAIHVSGLAVACVRCFADAMTPKNRAKLADRVARAAEAALADHHYVSAIDVLVGIRWLEPSAVDRWRQGQTDCLEGSVQTNLPRITEAMQLFRSWANAKRLLARETHYVARTPRRQTLQFSRSGAPTIEQAYRTHWISPELSERKRERLAEKASRAPDLVVIQPLNSEWTCHRCGGTGGLLIMEQPGPACLRCAGLDDLEFLSSGNALLTRRVKANSPRSAVVVRFSRTRRRYERQGVLVEPHILTDERRKLEGTPEQLSRPDPNLTQTRP